MASLSLKERMLAQLNSARFRYLNESFYTTSSEEALKLFQEDDDAFKIYHEGFSNQVSKWPVNPVDLMISYIENKKLSNLVIADLGCGDAKIARTIKDKVVHSFDLVALNKHVTACDMNKVPLKTSSVDIAVCCLSLMGTNFIKSLIEASRILKNNGTFLIAEVVSRFDSVQSFVRAMDKMGFLLIKKDESNKMFLWFEFRKVGKVPPVGKMPKIELAPCLYKRR
ncbi:hypothetical protein HELRODRAFT_83432 [Helobdella robusta]|uniref:Ribosomal RNA-processing protein 8 n=1 Tax=Helobdella robusta TaxID=6412 RepID=T1G555_HELRO|nr:hypothetical protein HELRODRAFT_83432 [Helobdella robusta]ESN99930.1 hypothetical protein HELRODRAFT_83432 [Helobdella robusta]